MVFKKDISLNYCGLESLRSQVFFGLISFSVIFISLKVEAHITKIAIFDTGFCISKIVHGKNIKIHEPVQTTKNGHKENCDNLNQDRYHGHHVIQTLTHELNLKKTVEIYPVIIFDDRGFQDISYWQKALTMAKEKMVDAILLASALSVTSRSVDLQFPDTATLFVASGSVGRGIRKNTLLWPQLLAPRLNMFLIGSYITSQVSGNAIFDSSLLNENKIDLYLSGENKHFPLSGTSSAVAVALAQTINVCPLGNGLRMCLDAKKIPLTFINKSHINAYTLKN